MSQTEEITRRLSALKQSAQEFLQMVSLIDGNFDGKLNEIRMLENRAAKLKEENDGVQKRATEILQKAVEESAAVNKEARQAMEQASAMSIEAKQDQERAKAMIAEAQALTQQAIQRQKEADVFWRQNEERKRKMEEAVRG